jgi:hypothetical protein
MQVLHYVEDYILAIAGYELYESPALNIPWPLMFTPIIKLARYDHQPLENFVSQISSGIGFTAKQADLASKIVCKYERQLKEKGFDVGPVKDGTVTFRLPIRSISYEKLISVNNNIITVVFPYNELLIKQFREYAKSNDSQGKVEWNADQRHWEMALTEGNLVWLLNLPEKLNFQLDSSLDVYIDLCAQAVPCYPTLSVKNNELVLDNFPSNLVKFLEEKLGGLGLNNIVKIADYAPICMFDLDPSVDQYLKINTQHLIKNRTIKNEQIDGCHPSVMAELCTYIKDVERYPVIVFDPHQVSSDVFSKHSLAGAFIKEFGEDGVVFYNSSVAKELSNYRVIVTNSVAHEIENINPIGVLISANGLMLNAGRRQLLLQNAEKVVYFTHHIGT